VIIIGNRSCVLIKLPDISLRIIVRLPLTEPHLLYISVFQSCVPAFRPRFVHDLRQ